jgi:glycosyltransferase involved in cell wall biosynthesis
MPPELPAIGVCCIRDPRDPAVWSRTPKNVCDLLAAKGRLGQAFWGLPHASLPMKLRAGIAALRYGRPRLIRRFLHTRSQRRAHAAHMLNAMTRSGLHHFLHFAGDRYLPLPNPPKNMKQYLLIDSTWNYWRDLDMPNGYFQAADADIGAGYRQMDHIFAVSEHARESLHTHYGVSPDKTSVVGTGRGAIKPYLGPKDYANGAILFVAKERFADKGGTLLFQGFLRAREKNPALQLWLVGDPALKELAGNSQHVTTYGFLPLDQLQALFEKASLFAMPASREPWGLVFLEAMTCKTPVLGLNRAAIPEITRNGQFGFAAKDATPDAIAATLLDAFSDLPRLEKMGLDAQAYATDHFTWDGVVDRMLMTIDRIAAAS